MILFRIINIQSMIAMIVLSPKHWVHQGYNIRMVDIHLGYCYAIFIFSFDEILLTKFYSCYVIFSCDLVNWFLVGFTWDFQIWKWPIETVLFIYYPILTRYEIFKNGTCTNARERACVLAERDLKPCRYSEYSDQPSRDTYWKETSIFFLDSLECINRGRLFPYCTDSQANPGYFSLHM